MLIPESRVTNLIKTFWNVGEIEIVHQDYTILTHRTDKGQLISKCPFAVFKSTKKPKEIFKDFWPSLKKEVKLKNKGTLHH